MASTRFSSLSAPCSFSKLQAYFGPEENLGDGPLSPFAVNGVSKDSMSKGLELGIFYRLITGDTINRRALPELANNIICSM